MSNFDAILAGLEPTVAASLMAKFRAAERRWGAPLRPGYLARMVRNHKVDLVRARDRAERATERRVIEQAKAVERERRVEVFVEAESQFDELISMDWAARLTPVQEAQLHVLRLVVFEGRSQEQLAERMGRPMTTIWQWISRGRKLIRHRAESLGFAALLEVVIESRISPLGGAVGFRDDH